MSTHKPCFWCLCIPFPVSALSKSLSLAGKLAREWTKMARVRIGAHAMSFTHCHRLGSLGVKLGWCLKRIQTESRETRPGAELETVDPGRAEGGIEQSGWNGWWAV